MWSWVLHLASYRPCKQFVNNKEKTTAHYPITTGIPKLWLTHSPHRVKFPKNTRKMTWYFFLDLWGRGRNSSELAAGFCNYRLNKPYGIYHLVKLHVSKTSNCSRSHYSPLRDLLFFFKKKKWQRISRGFCSFILWNCYYCTHQILWKSSSITWLFLSIVLAAIAIGVIKSKYHMNYIFWSNTYLLLAPSNNWKWERFRCDPQYLT